MANDNNLVPFKKGGDERQNKGRKKGSKNLATIVRELEKEDFDWSILPIKDDKKLRELVEQFGPIGSPFRVIALKAMLDAISGNPHEKASAREWLRKSGYGDKYVMEMDKGTGFFGESKLVITIVDERPKSNAKSKAA